MWNDDASAKVDGVADKDEEEEEDEEDDDDDDDDHRMFSFEVAKTLEQDENVTCREGFNVSYPTALVNHPNCHIIDYHAS